MMQSCFRSKSIVSLGAVLLAGLVAAPAVAQISPHNNTGQPVLNPDLAVLNICENDPVSGQNAVTCRIEVNNVGGSNSYSPVTISGNTAGSTVGSTPGITFSGHRPGSTFLCSTPAGPLPASFTCGGPLALTTGNNPGHGGPLMVGFVVPPGRTLRNCVTVSQGAGPNPDVNRRNDTNICASFTRPVGPR